MRGHIRKRGKRSWEIAFDLPREADGKRRQVFITVHGTKRDAEAKLQEMLTSLHKGEFVKPVQETVGAFLQRWLETYASCSTSPRTLRDYKGIVRRYLVPYLGPVPLSRLRPDHVQSLYADMNRRGLSAQTILHTHRLLSEALSYAVKWGLLSRNVCQVIKPPSPAPKQMRILTPDELRKFLEACRDSPYWPVFWTALTTGLRRSELLGLRWRDVDLERGVLSVTAALHRLPGSGLKLLAPKSSRSRRLVLMPPVTAALLREIRTQQEDMKRRLGLAMDPEDFVFARADGRPFDPEKVSKAFGEVAKKAGIEGIRLHDLRHTHASLMLIAGVHPKVVSERLGHASVAITMDIYSHVLPGLQEDAVTRLSHLLSPVLQAGEGESTGCWQNVGNHGVERG